MSNASPIPWNKDRVVGQKHPFSQDQIHLITDELEFSKSFRDLCLFCLGIDTMLRGSDLVRLKVSDVMDAKKHPKTEMAWKQTKTDNPVMAAITPYTQSAICCHVTSNHLQMDDYLFTAKRSDGARPISTSTLRILVKDWAQSIGLHPEHYSGHSLRRTKPAMMYSQGVRSEPIRRLLGHQNLKSTQNYLGIDQREALDLARKHDCFRKD